MHTHPAASHQAPFKDSFPPARYTDVDRQPCTAAKAGTTPQHLRSLSLQVARSRLNGAVLLTALLLISGCSKGLSKDQPVEGLYVRDDGKTLIVSGRDEETLRYRVLETGETGALWSENGEWVSGAGWAVKSPAAVRIRPAAGAQAATLTFTEQGRPQHAKRVALIERRADIPFAKGTLHAKLVLPSTPGPHALVVTVHGSEDSSAVTEYPYDKMFASRGLATLIFDKRGTGKSTGKYTQDFSALADDVNVAVAWAQKQDGIDPSRVALVGFSQGGWVAPLAAARNANIRAVAVSYGLLISPFDQALLQAKAPMQPPQFAEQDLAEVDALARAALPMLRARFRNGFAEFGSALDQSRGRPWRASLGNGLFKEISSYPVWALRLAGPFMDQETSWEHSGTNEMQQLNIPTFWQIAAQDQVAPPAATLQHLSALRAAGKPVTFKVYDGADHGLLTFSEKDGKRELLQHHPESLSDLTGWLAEALRRPLKN
jgi:uncharacterized protein